MKKILLFLIPLCVCLCAPCTSSAQVVGGGSLNGGSWNNGGNSPITIIPKPGTTNPSSGGGSTTGNIGSGPRSAIETIAAVLDFDLGQIEVCFTREVGVVTVSVVNAMGQAISSYTCDTAAEWIVTLPIPRTEGYYTLNIEGAEYCGSGEFGI